MLVYPTAARLKATNAELVCQVSDEVLDAVMVRVREQGGNIHRSNAALIDGLVWHRPFLRANWATAVKEVGDFYRDNDWDVTDEEALADLIQVTRQARMPLSALADALEALVRKLD